MFTPDERGVDVEDEFIHLTALVWLTMLRLHNWWVGLFDFIKDPDVRSWVTYTTEILVAAGAIVVTAILLRYVCIGLAKVLAKTASIWRDIVVALYTLAVSQGKKAHDQWRTWRVNRARRSYRAPPLQKTVPPPQPPLPPRPPPLKAPTVYMPPSDRTVPPKPPRVYGRARVTSDDVTSGSQATLQSDDTPLLVMAPPEPPRPLGQAPSAERDAYYWQRMCECVEVLRRSGLRHTSVWSGRGAVIVSRQDKVLQHVPFSDVVSGRGWSSQDNGGGSAPMEVRVTADGWEVVSSYVVYEPGSTKATYLPWRISSATPDARSQVTIDPKTKDELGVTVEEAYRFVAAWVIDMCQPRF